MPFEPDDDSVISNMVIGYISKKIVAETKNEKSDNIFSSLSSCVCFVMVWLHRGIVSAAIKGESLPEAPKGCPAYRATTETEEFAD